MIVKKASERKCGGGKHICYFSGDLAAKGLGETATARNKNIYQPGYKEKVGSEKKN